MTNDRTVDGKEDTGKLNERAVAASRGSAQPLITIIVPVYQVYQYLGECVESLLGQTYTNLEIILIDDGSTDGSGGLCDAYAARDARVRVIHQGNRGLSAARNKGLDNAHGAYIAFVDSDDVVAVSYIEELYGLIVKYHADIAACTYVKCRTEERRPIGNGRGASACDRGKRARKGSSEEAIAAALYAAAARNEGEVCMSSRQLLRQWHGRYKRWETVVWNKLYRSSVLNGGDRAKASKIRFPEGRRHEDVLTSHLIVDRAKRVALTRRTLYLYRVRTGSIIAGVMSDENRRQNLSAQRERMAFFKERRYWRAYLNLLAGYVAHVVWFGWKRG